jgi:hypothetical protein
VNQGPIDFVVRNCVVEGGGSNVVEFYYPRGGKATISSNTIKNSQLGVVAGHADAVAELRVENNTFINISTKAIDKHFGITHYCLQNNTLDGNPMENNCNLSK